jgi:actinin alpha
MFIVHSVDEIQGLINAHEQFKATLPEADKEYHGIYALAQEAQHICAQHGLQFDENPYTSIQAVELQSKWQEVQYLVPLRDQTLQKEASKQQQNDNLRIVFAQKANVCGPWIERQHDQIANATMNMQGLEQQLHKLKLMEQALVGFKPNIDELENINKDIQEALIFENRHTSYTMETIRVGWEQLGVAIARNTNEVENQILTRDSKGISEEQMNEFRMSFNHFDKSRQRRLEPKEFRSCLISLGYNIRDDKQGDADFQRIMSIVDPNATGYVPFDSFMDFMTRDASDQDTADQIIQSFRVLANNKPYITAAILRRELPPDQAQYCINRMQPYRGADGEQGALDYTSFSTALYGESDL